MLALTRFAEESVILGSETILTVGRTAGTAAWISFVSPDWMILRAGVPFGPNKEWDCAGQELLCRANDAFHFYDAEGKLIGRFILTVVSYGKVRMNFDFPREVPIHRKELLEAKCKSIASQSSPDKSSPRQIT